MRNSDQFRLVVTVYTYALCVNKTAFSDSSDYENEKISIELSGYKYQLEKKQSTCLESGPTSVSQL